MPAPGLYDKGVGKAYALASDRPAGRSEMEKFVKRTVVSTPRGFKRLFTIWVYEQEEAKWSMRGEGDVRGIVEWDTDKMNRYANGRPCVLAEHIVGSTEVAESTPSTYTDIVDQFWEHCVSHNVDGLADACRALQPHDPLLEDAGDPFVGDMVAQLMAS